MRWEECRHGFDGCRRRRSGTARCGTIIDGRKPVAAVVAFWVFVLVPFAALAAAAPAAWGGG
ncbi:hypothetical protein MTP10_15915 [Nonomuraea sp. 3-1Str]|uniref:hypothetical protein n=1 Tax=Nonomuraea sp. 3-1Str TaxID=2929801 RepID=UPI0028617582|nr:hypothetical protein [Nonomuraea sp. 3-1Str]MDR8410219.1 hypothetical protein [Nonomuraea sp. 3-1Str]